MKNLNIFLVLGLGVSLYFNWAAVRAVETGQLVPRNKLPLPSNVTPIKKKRRA